MTIPPQWLSKLRGTMGNLFGLSGPTGINIKNDSGTLAVRNNDDTDDVAFRALNIQISDSGNKITIAVPTLSGDTVYVLPSTDGTAGQILSTDGSGNLSWIDH